MRLIFLILFFPTIALSQTYIQGKNLIQIPAVTATAAGTTTLVLASDSYQVFTGSTTQNVVLPNATGLQLGRLFTIENQSSGVVTVKYNDASTALALPASSIGTFNLTNNGSSNGTWSVGAISAAFPVTISFGAFGSTPNANGGSISSGVITLQPADATHPGGIATSGNLTDAGTDGITVGTGTGAVIGSGTSLSQHVADSSHNGYLSSTDWTTFNGKGAGTVTSVALSVPATSIFGTSGSPVTTSGTLGLTTTGTSGGVPYFSSTSQLASSGLLTASQLLLGGGSGAAPTALAAGTQYQALVMGASNPGYGALDLGQAASHTGVLGISNGGTNSSSVVSAPAASAWAGWDANKNLSATSLIPAFTTTATAAGTTTLTVSSNQYQAFTGSANQQVTLPVASTLVAGQSYYITNTSSGSVTVVTSGVNTIQAMAQNTTLLVWVVNAAGGTGTASWNWSYNNLNNSGVPAANPMTTKGDLMMGDTLGVPVRLARGGASTFLQGNSGTSFPFYQALQQTDLPATSVQSGTATQMNITTATASANCASSPCTLINSVGVTNVTRSGTGSYSMNLSATYAALGPCFVMCQDGANNQTQPAYGFPTTTAFTFQCRIDTTGSNSDSGFIVACFGRK